MRAREVAGVSPLRVERQGRAHVVVLAGPPVNALTEELIAALEQVVEQAHGEARALAIVSDVPRVFMAGADIALLSDGTLSQQVAYVRRLQALFTAVERLPLPVVAGIDGACLGGGLELSLACDVRIVASAARLGLPEVGLGILAGAGGTQRCVRAVGQTLARDVLLTGRRLSGEEAVAQGLASRLAADEAGAPEDGTSHPAAAAARALAAQLAEGSPEALAATRRLALAASDRLLEDGLRAEVAEWETLRATPNSAEGLGAFLEKRPVRFA
jgi:enoyl-CoA hydratase